MKSFIYELADKLTGMKYIGVHKGTPDDGYVCSSKYLLKEYNVRPDDFTRTILEFFDDFSIARDREIELLTDIDAARNPLYYNKSNGTGIIQGKHDEETKKKISLGNTGKIMSAESRLKISNTLKEKGISPPSRLGQSSEVSVETREKISNTLKTIGFRPPTRKGSLHSPETKLRMCLAQKARRQSKKS